MRPITFFRTLFNSISSPKYYIDVLNVRFRFSTRFLIVSYIFLTLLASLLFLIIDTPKIERTVTSYIDQEIAEFPADRQISWNGLKLSMTPSDTFEFPFPQFPDLYETPQLLAQVNPAVTSAADIKTHSKHQSMLFIGQTELFVAQPGGEWSPVSLGELLGTTNLTITKDLLTTQAETIRSNAQTAVRTLPIFFPFFFFLLAFPLRLVGVILDSVLIYFSAKLFGYPLTFKKTQQISFHTMVAAELVQILTANFTTELPMFTIAFWLYTLIIYWNLRHIQAMPIDALADREKDQN